MKEKYRFTLIAYGKSHICDRLPIEWQSGVDTFTRDIDKGGIVNEFIVDSLTFTGSGARFIKEQVEKYEINGEMSVIIARFNRKLMKYVDYPTTYALDLGSFKVVKIGDFSLGVSVPCISSGVHQLIKDRGKVKLNLLGNESIDGLLLPTIDLPTAKVTMQPLKSFNKAKLSASKNPITNSPILSGYLSIPVSTIISDFPETTNNLMVNSDILTLLPRFFINSSNARTLDVDFTVQIEVTNPKTVGDNAYNLRIARFNSSDQLQEERTVVEFGKNKAVRTFKTKGNPDIFGEALGTQSFNMDEGDSLRMYFFTLTPGAFQGWEAFYNYSEIIVTETIANTQTQVIEGLPVFEAFERAAQMILNKPRSFYSEKFGRVDRGYLSENQLNFACIFSGTNIRGLSINDSDAQINITFDELFRSLSCLYGLGMSIEIINDEYLLRVEDYSYYFNDTEIDDLTNRISKYDITIEYMPQLAYIQILLGYKNFDYNATNGRGEYNTECSRTTVLKSDGELNLVSEIRGDTIGFINCIQKPISLTGSEDIEEDNDIFILKTQKTGDSQIKWINEFQENVEIIDDSSLFKESSLNLFFTPLWNMIRNSNRFTSALQKQLSSKIKHQTTTKLSNLRTKFDGKTYTENEDIFVNDLQPPKYKPFKHIFTCMFTEGDMDLLRANPYGYYTFTGNKKGYVMKVSRQINKDEATIELIEKL